MEKFIMKRFWKVLAGVLSCCMLLCGCGVPAQEELSWQMEDAVPEQDTQIPDEESAETEPSEETQNLIYVYLCGAVANPGVYQIAEGSRLFEAVEAAGGMLDDADLTSQNLARVVQDGEQIRIFTKEEIEELGADVTAALTGSISQGNGLVNINTASVQELTTISGIGESRAEAIIKYRETNGLFKSIDGIKKVAGIKEGLFERIKDQITV